jgi:sugar (pentulose or hexulose) kinase
MSSVVKIPVERLLNDSKTENEIFSPDPENAKFYDNKFETYKQLYPALKQFWKV